MTLQSSISQALEMASAYPDNDYSFLSVGNPNSKAVVHLFKNKRNLKNNIIKFLEKYRKKSGKRPQWIKLDFVTDTEEARFEDVKADLINTRRNYVDYGIALDENWDTVFLPEEINVNAFVRPGKDKKGFILSETNINTYLNKYKRIRGKYSHANMRGADVIKFRTKSFFIENDQVYDLHAEGYMKGLRKVHHLAPELDDLICKATDYLGNEIQENGKYIYGYFPHFDKKINFYNNLRHSSSTYALIEGLAYCEKDITLAKKPLEYLIEHYLYEVDGKGHIFDDTKNINEIKLGQNAAFVFAVCEYLRYNPEEKGLLEKAQLVANGILSMIDPDNAQTTHVINYPDLTTKEQFRVVYYDGEAALALLRLYQIDHNETWLKAVQGLFEKFIAEKYWQYHDHWLGYCTNELVQIDPQRKYFEFGIQNVAPYLNYIRNRETTFPTFLEVLMATYHLIQKAKKSGHADLVEELIDEEEFIETIHIRVNYERVGFFYPELAMYFKNPARIINSFFIKHHGYRVRIDDIEHYISGLVQYRKVFND